MKQRFSFAVLFALALILISLPLPAQDSRGAISGIVKDGIDSKNAHGGGTRG